jgi:hypothetical protein
VRLKCILPRQQVECCILLGSGADAGLPRSTCSRLSCIRTGRELEPSRELDALYSLAYEELRHLARATLSHEMHASISLTTLSPNEVA